MTSSSTYPNVSCSNLTIGTNTNPYLAMNWNDPAYTTVTDTRTFVFPPWFQVIVPKGSQELVEIARKACGLMLRMEAEKVPHIHYPFQNTASSDNNVKKNVNNRNEDDDNINIKRVLNSCKSDKDIKGTSEAGESTVIKQEYLFPVSGHRLHNLRRVRGHCKHRRPHIQPSHGPSLNLDPNTVVTRSQPPFTTNQDLSIGNSSTPRAGGHVRNKGRPQIRLKCMQHPDAERPRLLIKLGYEKHFLAGPPKKDTGDRRIFYQWKLVCQSD